MTLIGLVVMTGIGGLLYWRGWLRGGRVVYYALLAMPLWWTGDKILQIMATKHQEAIALAQIQDENFIAELFDLSLPLRYANGYSFQGESLSDNELIDYLTRSDVAPRHGFEAIIEVGEGRRKNPAESSWYSYQVEMCGDAVCPYDPGLARPIPPRDRAALMGEVLSKTEVTTLFWYPIMTEYGVSLREGGSISGISVSVVNTARNPFDRAVRQIFQRKPPDYWDGPGGYALDFVTGQQFGWGD